MRPCVRYLMAAANLTAARPQDVSSLGLMDILNSGLYCAAASGPAWKRPAVTMRRTTLHFMATPSCIVSTQNSNPKGGGRVVSQCPPWVKSRHMLAIGNVRFTPNSDRESEFPQRTMSALPPKADMCSALAYVCFGPKAD